MNTPSRTILAIAVFAIASSALGAKAADNGDYLKQMQMDEGYADSAVVTRNVPVKPETAKDAARITFQEKQQEVTDGYYPRYNVVPRNVPAKPETAKDAARIAFQEKQQEVTDGYYPLYNVVPTAARTKPATPMQAAISDWFDARRTADSNGSKPVAFVPPKVEQVGSNAGERAEGSAR